MNFQNQSQLYLILTALLSQSVLSISRGSVRGFIFDGKLSELETCIRPCGKRRDCHDLVSECIEDCSKDLKESESEKKNDENRKDNRNGKSNVAAKKCKKKCKEK
mmetsp:Transcript_23617/g.49860  ORF Transcript_23617/g.49860 Transcript_23617/m.49860 type:complete len:105 (+) Transcript_23617:442-756(+)